MSSIYDDVSNVREQRPPPQTLASSVSILPSAFFLAASKDETSFTRLRSSAFSSLSRAICASNSRVSATLTVWSYARRLSRERGIKGGGGLNARTTAASRRG